MDTLGPLPETDGHRHVLIIIDAFSKFCLLYPMFRQDTDELKQHFTTMVSLFGTPKLIVTDRGRMFQCFKALILLIGSRTWPAVLLRLQLILNITKRKTTQYSALNLLIGTEAATPLIRSLIRDVTVEGSSGNREVLRQMSRQRASKLLRAN